MNVELVNDVKPRLKMFGSLVSIEEIIVTNANTMEFIHMNVHPCFVINLYLTPSLVSIRS